MMFLLNLKTVLAKQYTLVPLTISWKMLNGNLLLISLQIVGPMADNMNNIVGDYVPDPSSQYQVTPRKGLQNVATIYSFAEGCQNSDPKCLTYDAASISKAVDGADIIVVCLGTGKICLVFFSLHSAGTQIILKREIDLSN